MLPSLAEKHCNQGQCDKGDVDRNDLAGQEEFAPDQIAVVNDGHRLSNTAVRALCEVLREAGPRDPEVLYATQPRPASSCRDMPPHWLWFIDT